MLIWKGLKRLNLDIAKSQRQLRRLESEEPGEKTGEKMIRLIARLNSLKGERAFFMKEERLYSQVFRMQAAEFGLTPRGRVGLAVVGGGDPDEGAELLT